MVKDESEFNKGRRRKDGLQPYCKDCSADTGREWHYKHGGKPMSENKKCGMYLGCYINERILKHVMPNAILMDNCNPGYDLICGKGYLVDAKSATLQHGKNTGTYWQFRINCNKTPDYFLLTAYKDRESLEICHMWLIPGDVINDKKGLTISLSTINKWSEYKIDHTEALTCATQLKASA